MRNGEGFISIELKEKTPILYFNSGMGDGFTLVTVYSADISGYQARSCGGTWSNRNENVTAFIVAEWWRDLLMDIMDSMVRSVEPSRTVNTNYGFALRELHKCARIIKYMRQVIMPMMAFNKCLDEMSLVMKTYLLSAAKVMPPQRCQEEPEVFVPK